MSESRPLFLFAAALTLSRSLFGDFDIEAIMDSSNSYLNLIMFIAYLFFAVFILLSIFLTILGEHQGYVRDEEQQAKDDEPKKEAVEALLSMELVIVIGVDLAFLVLVI